ncbi:NAD(P)H-dependent oxidoreductase [Desmospora activa]|uniref:Putative NADPH-quinone reductase n=1 Tax=Desmospora activa DSM 45169 TaxID=1121389 RepID=A0A2T4ZA83_9BACL|nr:NAD(P)H-dependent oxidoreductase [Desmospora activa]PTM58783.1 putative NADPH-quinone reductase [Desmospora activa DSM 45169]
MPQRILIIQAHPHSDSLSSSLAQAYQRGAEAAGRQVRVLELGKLDFDPNLAYGYKQPVPLEKDLVTAQESILWANHIVWIFPVWWGMPPALLKGFIDRVFLPGFAFQYHPQGRGWERLLTGRTARVFVTMDAPYWYYRWINGMPAHRSFKRMILQFCGIRPVRFTNLCSVRHASEKQIQQWLEQAEKLGGQVR